MIDPFQKLEWDSQFFDKKVGKIHVPSIHSLHGILKTASHQKYDLLYIFSDVEISDQKISSFELLDVGGHIKFAKSLEKRLDLNSPVLTDHGSHIYSYRAKELSHEIREIAYLSGHMSRFRIDPFLPSGSFEKLYELWLEKTLKSYPTAAIYVYQVKEKPVGLVSYDWVDGICSIGLLAVLPGFQGLGFGAALMRHVESLSIAKSIHSIQVKTQLCNEGARSLYGKKLEYDEVERSFLYHAHRLAT
jgi:dTDP-4-amino-4,6-dideoxy-D-galactose acyltransferase